MSAANQILSHSDTERPLADRLRMTLVAARGNLQIRERLKRMIADPDRLDSIVRELGPRHALVGELLKIARHGESAAERVG